MRISKKAKEEKTIRAYELAESRGLLPFIHEVKKKFALTRFSAQQSHISSFIFGGNKPRIELVAMQFLFARLATPKLNEKLLCNLAFGESVQHELPAEWKKILLQEKIDVDGVRSSWKFSLYVIKRFLENIRQGTIMLAVIFLSRQKKIISQKKYVQFCDLTATCLPWPDSEDDYTVINWYINWEGRIHDISEIHHNLNRPAFTYKSLDIIPAKHFFQYISDIRSKIHLLLWFAGSVLISFYSLLFGRWINAVLLLEAFFAKIVELTDNKFLPREYVFSISSFSYRPLWSYTAEKKGSQVTNISYASSFGGFKLKTGYVDREYYFDTCTWPRLLYWTDDYISFIRSKVDAGIEVIHTPPIYFSDYPFEFPSLPENSIAIFDVSPVEPYITATMIPEMPYRNYKNGKQFLMDIYEVFGSAGFTIVWKRKRSFGSIHSMDYINFCDKFEKLPRVVVIHPDVSAFQVIKHCDYCISMPFTSTAFVADYFNKPSIFYDNTTMLEKDDRGAQQIPLISGINELTNWKEKLVKEKKYEKNTDSRVW